MTEEKDFKMELTFERSFLPTRSSNIKIIAYIDGQIDENIFREAINKLAMKHPFLRSKVVMQEDGIAYLTTEGGKKPEAVVVPGKSNADVFEAIYQEDKQPSNWETDPTSRFILVKGAGEAGADVVVAYIHHVIADGRSTIMVLKHLFEFIADQTQEIEELIPVSLVNDAPADVVIPEMQRNMAEQINAGWSQQKVTFNVDDFIEIAEQKYAVGPDVYVDHALTTDETIALRNKSKKQGVSVNAALLAAILIAKKHEELEPSPDKLGFAVDVRNRLTKDAGEACNLLASAAMVDPEYNEDKSFWELAKDIHTKTLAALESNQNLFGTRMMSKLTDPTFNDAMYMFQRGSWEGTPMIKQMGTHGQGVPVGAVLTNLGGIQLPAEYEGQNPVKLKDAIFYPPIGIEKVIELGASSLLGKLHIVTLSPQNAANRELKERVIPKIIEILKNNL
ncbi:MAG: condensation domain-containing protein [Candidatus Thorarchaeota archaeon]